MRSLIVLVAALFVVGTSAPAYSDATGDLKAGVAALDRGDWAEGIRLISLAINSGQLKPDELVVAYGNRGAAYYQLDQNERALADFTRSIELIPGSGYDNEYAAYSYSNRASLHITMGNFNAALQDCEQALRLNPKDWLGFYNRALARENLGQRNVAIEDYRMVLTLDPGYEAARTALKRLGATP